MFIYNNLYLQSCPQEVNALRVEVSSREHCLDFGAGYLPKIIMKYRIIILPAKADIKEAAQWIRQYSREKANAWVDGIYEAINSLATYPARCAVIPLSNAFDVPPSALY